MDYRIRLKTLMLSLGSCATFLLVYISVFTNSGPSGNGLYSSPNFSSNRTIIQTALSIQPGLINSDRCRAHENVMFLKTHKCASSTIQNILMRFGDSRNLTIVLPPDGNYLGHPAKFTTNLTLPLPSSFSNHFNIFCHHTRWHEENTKAILPFDTFFISILKEPATMFESLYNWVKLDVRYGVPLERFVENPAQYYYNSSVKDFARNPMTFDFGLETENFENSEKIQEKIDEIDRRFALVMLAEFVDESLVLLRNLLCWDWEDVVVFRVNSRKTEYKKQISPEIQEKIRKWNFADKKFYEHFRTRFLNQTKQYGAERMRQDVKRLRDLTTAWYNFCVLREISKNDTSDLRFQVWHPTVTGFQLTPAGLRNPTCIRLATAENPYTDALRAKLWPAYVMSKLMKPLTQRSPEFW